MSNNWTTADIPDLTGKIAIVTGANSGLGLETARELARKGAITIMACRSIDKAQAALDDILAEIPNAPVKIMQLDLASLASVQRFAAAFQAEYLQLDLLINNAGIMMVPYGTTEDGFEQQFGTNHLGHFALTGLLFELLLKTPNSRVVNVSSSGHRFGRMDFDNLMYESGQGYSPTSAYGRSKLANLLFTKGLQKRFEQLNADSLALSAHPGGSNTNLAAHLENRFFMRLMRPLLERMTQTAAMGALPTLRAALDPAVKGEDYFGPSGFMEMSGYPVLVQSNAAAQSEADSEKLWQVSEQLTAVHYEEKAR